MFSSSLLLGCAIAAVTIARSASLRLGGFKSRDRSTNLNGAIVEAVKILDRQMRSSSVPLTFGTLVRRSWVRPARQRLLE
jgi:hypothetical protein